MKLYAKTRLKAAKRLEELKESTLRHIANNPKDKRSRQARRVLDQKYNHLADKIDTTVNLGRTAAGLGSVGYGLYTGNPAAIGLGVANTALGLGSFYKRYRAKQLLKKPKHNSNSLSSWI